MLHPSKPPDSSWKELFNDPISLEPFKDPVVASDGYTYEFEMLKKHVQNDPQRRSPITKEVLRPLVYTNSQMMKFLRSKKSVEPCRKIYSRIECREMTIPLDTMHAKCPWIVRFLTKVGWRRSNVTLRVIITMENGEWSSVGPKVAHPWKECFTEWVVDFGLDKLFNNPECLTFAKLYVNDKYQATMEEVCGSSIAESCRTL